MDHDELIFRSLQGRLSSQEAARLVQWREADPEHEKRYRDFAAVWRATRDLEGDLDTEPPELEAVTAAPIRDPGSGRRPWRRKLWRAGGAVAAFVAGVALAAMWQASPVAESSAGEVVTQAGETMTTRLPDGTIVRLAPESRLVLPTSADNRTVTLDGKAFFAVSKDPANPFVVRTPSGVARVLGTRFELNARRDHLRLLVVEGRVSVASGEAEVQVGTRQMTHIREGEAPSTVDVDDVWPLLSWMGDFLAFESTPLRDVRTELERRFDISLVFDDPDLAEETVTVWFRNESIDEVVSVLCRLLETHCSVSDSVVQMSRAS